MPIPVSQKRWAKSIKKTWNPMESPKEVMAKSQVSKESVPMIPHEPTLMSCLDPAKPLGSERCGTDIRAHP